MEPALQTRPVLAPHLDAILPLATEERLVRMAWLERLVRGADGVPSLSPEWVAEQGRAVLIVDVRRAHELSGPLGHLPGSTLLPASRIEELVPHVRADTMIVLVSGKGDRSAEAVRTLLGYGLRWVASMAGGITAFRALGYGTLRTTETTCFADGQIRLPTVQSGKLAAEAAAEPAQERKLLTRQHVAEHVGDPRSVHWVKLAAMLLRGKISCVDGRDDHGVVGSPGGDAGEVLLTLGAAEAYTGKQLDLARMPTLLRAWLDAFGAFYMHSDIHAHNTMIKALRSDQRFDEVLAHVEKPHEWRAFFAAPPASVRELVLDALTVPEHLGCGHLRMTLQRPEDYGVRRALSEAFLRAYHLERWQSAPEPSFVTLGGGHAEGAVVLVELAQEPRPFSYIPLVSPAAEGSQMFVDHPQVISLLRRQWAQFLVSRGELGLTAGDEEGLFNAIQELGARQLKATLSKLAAGLPMYRITYDADRSVTVSDLG